MFDKLIESSSTGAELGPRRRIFAATLVLVTVLFATAVVASIYAADFDLEASNFDIAELLTPVTETEPPREPEPQQRQNSQASTSDRTTRVMNIQRPDETPVTTPPISTTRSPYLSRPIEPFEINPRGVDSNGYPSDSIGTPGGGNPSTSSSATPGTDSQPIPSQPPPAVKKPERKPATQSLGVINGRAADLPHPPYPAPARAVGASGSVDVQVTIDENGSVISAKAVSGHIMLRRVSEDAARRAKFTPTLLSNVPVKVTGVIVYNFKKN